MSTSSPPDLTNDDASDPVKWWLGQMTSHRAGVHEKMTWFWHGVVPVSHSKVYWWQVEWPAHVLLRRYALGSYRSFLKKMTVTPAMLIYLDGSWSTVQGPNENYARELQELFTHRPGAGHGGERPARGPGTCRAGTSTTTRPRPCSSTSAGRAWAANQKVTLPGQARLPRLDGVVDAVCDHSATSRFIANKAWLYFVGKKPSAATLDSLARKYRSSGLNNQTLVKAILDDPQFLSSRFTAAALPRGVGHRGHGGDGPRQQAD